MDAVDNPQKYDKKKLTIKAKYAGKVEDTEDVLIMGRKAMVCCANDITDIAIPVIGINEDQIDKDQYYTLSGTSLCIENDEGMEMCALKVDHYQIAEAPKDELVTFN